MSGVISSTAPDSGAQTFRFSTDTISPRDRVAVWHDVLHRRFMQLETQLLSDDMVYRNVGVRFASLGIIAAESSAIRIARTRSTLSDGNDWVRIVMLRPGSGAATITQGKREFTLGPGQAYVVSNADPHTMVYPRYMRILALVLNRAVLRPLLRDVDSMLLRPIPQNVEALGLLAAYSGMLVRQPPDTADVSHLSVDHVFDLAALAVGATRDAAHVAETRGLRAARLNAIKSDALKNLASPHLSIDDVAVRLRISPRYIQLLFQDEDTTFSEFVLRQRLRRAWRMLTNPNLADRSITSVAFDCGFGDSSYFNRTFRRQYGCTPSDARTSMSI